MNSHQTILSARVAARNRANAKAKELAPQILNYCRAFIGEKVILATGSLSKKFNDGLPFKTQADGLTVWYDHSGGYSLKVLIRAHEMTTGRSYDAVAVVYLLDLNGGVASKLYDFDPAAWRVDFTEAEVLEARAELEAAKKEVSRIQSKLLWFGESDFNA